MDTICSPELSLNKLVVPVAGGLRMCFTATVCFALAEPAKATALLPPEKIWAAAMNALATEDVLDNALPKQGAEWLMAGDACAPQATTMIGLPVDVCVGELTRRFIVTGERSTDGVNLPQPKPFARMPMGWRQTYGGPEHKDNPLGCGMVSTPQGDVRLPSVFCEGRETEPACPGPRNLTVMHKQATGSYDAVWLRTRWPGVPDDFDWSVYNLAQPAQHQAQAFTGDEQVRVTNMHPDHPVLQGQLPGFRLRFFVDYGTETQADWREATPQADTVWLFPNDSMGALFWHVSVPTKDERGTDIQQVVAALEPLHMAPQPAAVCIAQALNPVAPMGETEALEPQPPMPAPEPEPEKTQPAPPPPPAPKLVVPPVPEISVPPAPEPADFFAIHTPEMQQDVRDTVAMVNADLAQCGLPLLTEADVYGHLEKQSTMLRQIMADAKEPAPSLETLLLGAGCPPDHVDTILEIIQLEPPHMSQFPSQDAYTQALDAFMQHFQELTGASESVQQRLLTGLQEIDKDTLAAMSQSPALDAAALQAQEEVQRFVDAGLSPEEALKWSTAIGLPLPNNASVAGLQAYFNAFEQTAGLPENSMAAPLPDIVARTRRALYPSPDIVQTLRDVAARQPEDAKGLSALADHLHQACTSSSLSALEKNGAIDLSALAQGYGVHGAESLRLLAMLDPLPDTLPATPVVPEQPAHATVQPLYPEDSVEPEPDPVTPLGAEQPEPRTAQDVCEALQAGKDLRQYNLSGFDFSGMTLKGFDFSGLLLDEAKFASCHMEGCTCVGTQFAGADFTEARLRGVDFSTANLAGSRLMAVQGQSISFVEADLTKATLHSSTLHDVQGAGAVFASAQLCALTLQGDFSRADFHAAQLEDVVFTDADLSYAQCSHSTWRKVSLHGTTANNMTFEASTMHDCQLSHANLRGIRMYDAVLHTCQMVGIDASNSNWFRVQMHACNMEHAVLTAAIFEECSMPAVHAPRVRARGCQWLDCDLTNARLPRLDLFEGALRGSRLDGADLSGSSLYGADLYLTDITTRTNMLDADVTRTCLLRGEGL